MKVTTAYQSEFLHIVCPYCQADIYIDVADDPGEGYIKDEGRRLECKYCGKEMIVLPDY